MKKTLRGWNSTLRPVSKKRQKLMKKRRPVVEEMKAKYPVCQICEKNPTDDIHEKLARSAVGSILNEENLAALCRKCHDWITHDAQGVKWAVENDYVISRYDVRAKALKADGKTDV